MLALLEGVPAQIPVVVGGCGTGRTNLLIGLRARLGPASQYVDVERTATTPERFLRAIVSASTFTPPVPGRTPETPREAFDQTLRFLDQARAADGSPVVFLLDEVLELRTFESFPGLRSVLANLFACLQASPNRFVLTSRYATRCRRAIPAAADRFVIQPMPPLALDDIRDALRHRLAAIGAPVSARPMSEPDEEYLACAVYALSDGRAAYARAIVESLAAMNERGGGDPVSALAAQLAPNGALYERCHFCYELRLHRARGYGALKAILEILADEEPLTLTEISHRLGRTPGSTKDYLSWLEDVDLVSVERKRYSFSDPLLRVWVRLHCRPTPATEHDIAREVQRFALARLPHPTGAYALAGAGASERKPWGIIEID